MTYCFVCLFVTRARQLGSDSLMAHRLVIATCAQAQTFDTVLARLSSMITGITSLRVQRCSVETPLSSIDPSNVRSFTGFGEKSIFIEDLLPRKHL